jgi:hypothetical protein
MGKTDEALADNPNTSIGVLLLLLVPSPICPSALIPQHFEPLVLVTIQVCPDCDDV